jgi:hypothetical protein
LYIIRVIKVKFKIYEWQHATTSGVEQTRHCQWCLLSKCVTDSDVFVNTSLLVTPLMNDRQ